MTPIEILALIVAVITLIKMVFFLIKPDSLLKTAESIFKCKALPFLYLIAAIIIGYFVFMELTIVQVFAAMFFLIPLIGMGIASFPKQTLALSKEVVKHREKIWYAFIIWTGLAIWTLVVLFA